MIATPNAATVDASRPECFGIAGRAGKHVAAKSAENGPRKILLPRRPGESKFAPPQYYYPASRSGVMPSWRLVA
jgi:hypothetical protein